MIKIVLYVVEICHPNRFDHKVPKSFAFGFSSFLEHSSQLTFNVSAATLLRTVLNRHTLVELMCWDS